MLRLDGTIIKIFTNISTRKLRIIILLENISWRVVSLEQQAATLIAHRSG